MPDQEAALRAMAARIVFPRLGSNMPPGITVEEDLDRFLRMNAQFSFGGLVLFNGSWPETQVHLEKVQAEAPVPMLVGTDMERGVGQQVHGLTVFPHAMAFQGMPEEEALNQIDAFARQGAREANAVGIHMAFAPVADVNRNPHNPIIGIRAFGTEAGNVSRLITRYIETAQSEGLIAVAKHYPGHGDTLQDSHAELPIVAHSREDLLLHDVAPFKAAVTAGVKGIMPAHVAFPALDPSGEPATSSAPILRQLLRDELGFDGAIITDSLIMGAIRERFPQPVDLATALLNAGIDIFLDPIDPPAMVAGIVEAVTCGRVDVSLLEEAVARVDTLRAQLPAPGSALPNPSSIADEIARQAISVVGDAPSSPYKPPAHVVFMRPYPERLAESVPTLLKTLRPLFPQDRLHVLEDESELAALEKLLGENESIFIAAVAKPAAWHRFGLPEWQKAFLRRLIASRPVMLASLGSPVILDDFPDAHLRLCAYSDVPVTQAALAQIVLDLVGNR